VVQLGAVARGGRADARGSGVAHQVDRRDPPLQRDEAAAHGIPEALARLKDAIAAADGPRLATPEYDTGMPEVAKNAIDGLSRPASDIARVFGGKPVAIAGASPGGFGAILAQNAWLSLFRPLGAEVRTGGRLLVSRAGNGFPGRL
jgi:NAD(P)H-dependent FMN reductase